MTLWSCVTTYADRRLDSWSSEAENEAMLGKRLRTVNKPDLRDYVESFDGRCYTSAGSNARGSYKSKVGFVCAANMCPCKGLSTGHRYVIFGKAGGFLCIKLLTIITSPFLVRSYNCVRQLYYYAVQLGVCLFR